MQNWSPCSTKHVAEFNCRDLTNQSLVLLPQQPYYLVQINNYLLYLVSSTNKIKLTFIWLILQVWITVARHRNIFRCVHFFHKSLWFYFLIIISFYVWRIVQRCVYCYFFLCNTYFLYIIFLISLCILQITTIEVIMQYTVSQILSLTHTHIYILKYIIIYSKAVK